ncbi:hypothetical protein ACIPJS_25680 [Streptomyces sp. NPDC086783]|uniref:hypothetical protein n=1 Tax=Streptomyces sp. NPDC086783 TaxID=3365758 RepID=UPI00380C60AC
MTHRDIALLLADAADDVEIGIAPYQAVLRGGRRRKARRWAVTAAAALVIAGSTGTLALAGGTSGGARRVEPAATRPATDGRVFAPRTTTLARGTDAGSDWSVTFARWDAPGDRAQAARQLEAMRRAGTEPAGVREAADLTGRGWFFVVLQLGDEPPRAVLQGEAPRSGGTLAGKRVLPASMPLGRGTERLVVGQVAPTARRAEVTWDDGSTTKVGRAAPGTGFTSGFESLIRRVDGSSSDWFVCLAARGRTFESAEVTK